MSILAQIHRNRVTGKGVPIVLFHMGNSSYLPEVIRRNRRVHDRIVLIGDDSNRDLGVEHVHYTTLGSPELDEFHAHFVNYSTNSANVERLCFSRMFYIRKWMEREGVDRCVYLDSDCVLLRPIAEIFDERPACSYRSGSNHMAASVHVSHLTLEFMLAFQKLCRDIFVTKTKFHLIADKIRHHQETGAPGGICDMTLYYLMTREMPIRALLDVQPDGSTFDDNINDHYGFNGPHTFVITNGTKTLRNVEGRVEALTTTGDWIRLNNLHFQGSAKVYI